VGWLIGNYIHFIKYKILCADYYYESRPRLCRDGMIHNAADANVLPRAIRGEKRKILLTSTIKKRTISPTKDSLIQNLENCSYGCSLN
jgi:hypothetical protein